jgi:uncharacterized protein
MKRLLNADLLRWKDAPRRKPLIVRGARQVGKTWMIEEFGKSCFRGTVKVDFEKRPGLRALFDGDLVPMDVVEQLELAVGQAIRPGA